MKAVLCKEVAEEQLEAFTQSWGLYDAKAIISGGAESSIPVEMSDTLLAGIMSGVVEITNGTVTHKLAVPIGPEDNPTTNFTYKRTAIKKHMLTEISEKPPEDQVIALAQMISGASDYEVSELCLRDIGITAAIATYISFS